MLKNIKTRSVELEALWKICLREEMSISLKWKLYSTQFGLRLNWKWRNKNFIGVNIIHSELSWIIQNIWKPSCFVLAISWAFLFLMPKLDTTPKSLPNVLVVFTNVLLFLKGNIWRKKCKLRYIEMIFGSNAKYPDDI